MKTKCVQLSDVGVFFSLGTAVPFAISTVINYQHLLTVKRFCGMGGSSNLSCILTIHKLTKFDIWGERTSMVSCIRLDCRLNWLFSFVLFIVLFYYYFFFQVADWPVCVIRTICLGDYQLSGRSIHVQTHTRLAVYPLNKCFLLSSLRTFCMVPEDV